MARSVVLFDGQCVVCRGSVAFLRRLDWLRRLAFVDIHDPAAAGQNLGLHRAALMGAIHVVTPGGRIVAGYEAVRHQIGQLPLLMWAYPLLFLPGVTWLGPRLYAWIARRRYRLNRWLGRAATCEQDVCQPVGRR